MVDVKKYPRAIKLAALKRLRSKVERELDIDLPPTHELHHMLNISPGNDRRADEKLQEIEDAIERRATVEELEEMDAESAALDSLADLEFALVQEQKEKDDAIRVREIEDEWDAARRVERSKPVTGAELQYYLDALDEYQHRLDDEKAIKAESKRRLSRDLRDLRRGIAEGVFTEEEVEARIQAFVKSARRNAKAVQKAHVKRVKAKA